MRQHLCGKPPPMRDSQSSAPSAVATPPPPAPPAALYSCLLVFLVAVLAVPAASGGHFTSASSPTSSTSTLLGASANGNTSSPLYSMQHAYTTDDTASSSSPAAAATPPLEDDEPSSTPVAASATSGSDDDILTSIVEERHTRTTTWQEAAWSLPPVGDTTPLLTEPTILRVCQAASLCSRIQLLSQDSSRLAFCDIFPVLPIVYNIVAPGDLEWRYHEPIDLLAKECPHTPQLLPPMQRYLGSQEACLDSLQRLRHLDSTAREAMVRFDRLLDRFPCVGFHDKNSTKGPTPGMASCIACRTAYKNWICSNTFDLFVGLQPPSLAQPSATPPSSQRYDTVSHGVVLKVPACTEWCTEVERNCPYFSPSEKEWNGGEPSFLCDESHYHHSSLYRPPETSNCGLGDNPPCCYADFHLSLTTAPPLSASSPLTTSNTTAASAAISAGGGLQGDACPSLEQMCRHKTLNSPADEDDDEDEDTQFLHSSTMVAGQHDNTGNETSGNGTRNSVARDACVDLVLLVTSLIPPLFLV